MRFGSELLIPLCPCPGIREEDAPIVPRTVMVNLWHVDTASCLLSLKTKRFDTTALENGPTVHQLSRYSDLKVVKMVFILSGVLKAPVNH